MNKHKRVLSWKLLLASLVVGLIACVAPSLAWADVPDPSTYTYIRKAEPKSIDPANAMDNYSLVVLADIYQRLVTLNRDDPTQVVGDAASTWSISPDGLAYTFNLRKGLDFHNGAPLTAQDVKYSIDRIILMNGPAGVAQDFSVVKGAETYLNSEMTPADVDAYLAAGGVQILDDYTVIVTLNYPYTPFLPMLCLFGFIVSEDVVEAHGGLIPGEENMWMSRNAIGSGPFEFVEWVPGQRLILERYGRYWKGPAALERVVVEFVSETATQLLELQTGDVDVIDLSSTQADQVLDMGNGKPKFPDVSVKYYPRLAVNCIFFNFAFEPFNNVKFREALVKAFPYELYIEEALYGILGMRANGVIPRGMLAYPTDIVFPDQDLVQAKSLFEEVGWTGTLTLTIRAGRTSQKQLALMFKDALESLDVGITVEVRELASSTFVSKMRKGELAFYPNGWGANYNDPDSMVRALYYSAGYYPVQQSFCDPTLDAWIHEAQQESDPVQRVQLYHNIVERANSLYVHIVTEQPFDLYAMRSWLRGWRPNPLKWSKESYFLYKAELE